jgi:hypothetical protein
MWRCARVDNTRHGWVPNKPLRSGRPRGVVIAREPHTTHYDPLWIVMRGSSTQERYILWGGRDRDQQIVEPTERVLVVVDLGHRREQAAGEDDESTVK